MWWAAGTRMPPEREAGQGQWKLRFYVYEVYAWFYSLQCIWYKLVTSFQQNLQLAIKQRSYKCDK